MEKLPRVTAAETIKVLERAGFVLVRQHLLLLYPSICPQSSPDPNPNLIQGIEYSGDPVLEHGYLSDTLRSRMSV